MLLHKKIVVISQPVSGNVMHATSAAGGNNRARTCDPLLVRQMLSQLSYAPI